MDMIKFATETVLTIKDQADTTEYHRENNDNNWKAIICVSILLLHKVE